MYAAIIFKNQRAAYEGGIAFREFRCISPSSHSIRGLIANRIIIMPDVDVYQLIEGRPLIRLLEDRQMTFPANERSIIQLRFHQ